LDGSDDGPVREYGEVDLEQGEGHAARTDDRADEHRFGDQLDDGEAEAGGDVDRQRPGKPPARQRHPRRQPQDDGREERPQLPVDERHGEGARPRQRPAGIGVVDPDLSREEDRREREAARRHEP